MNEIYDLAIIGMGPAGFSASVYASRYGISNIIIGETPGGLVSKTNDIGNWLGEEKISGYDFSIKALKHCQSYGAKASFERVREIIKDGDNFRIAMSQGNFVFVRTVLLATGTDHKHLNIPGEKEFGGKGVSYCATCDGFLYKDKKVAVVGGGDSALLDAVHLGNIAAKVYVIYRGDALKGEKHWQDKISANPKIDIVYGANLLEIKGSDLVKEIILDKDLSDGKNSLDVDAVFIAIGFLPQNELASQIGIDVDEGGYIKVDSQQRTSLDGVWGAGDVTTGSNKFKQIITAASEGAIAAKSIFEYLKRK